MQANPSRDTIPEKVLRSVLHRMGLRFRINSAPLKDVHCKADIVFRKAKMCVFIDGCFWHGCPKHFKQPKTNTEWWIEKVQDNKNRDKRKTLIIKKHGWIVLRYWEHEILQGNVIKIAEKIHDIKLKRVYVVNSIL